MPPVIVVLPVFQPERDLLDEQLNSVAKQSLPGVHVVIVVADCASRETAAELVAKHGLDFSLVEPAQRLDAPRAFEAGLARALALSGPETLIALCDQDDVWHPDRLEKGRQALLRSGAALAHSDARLIGPDGSLRHPSMFRFERRHRRPGLRGLLLRNNVTGMTSIMTRRLVERALPFPAQSGVHYYHDLWLALIAHATEGVVFLPQPTVDYRQHDRNVMGAIDRTTGVRFRVGLPDAMWLRREATAYALAKYLATSLDRRLRANGPTDRRLSPVSAYLGRWWSPAMHAWDMLRLAATGHGRLARIALGHTAASVGRVGWAWAQALGPGLRGAFAAFDERLYSLSPGVSPVAAADDYPTTAGAAQPAQALVDQRKTPQFRPVLNAPEPAVTVLVPTLNPTEIYAGIATALDIGAGLAARGHCVRFVATDLPIASAEASRQFIAARLPPGTSEAGVRFSLLCGRLQPQLSFHPDDCFLATAWWTAHLVQALRPAGFRRPDFLYLLQDYEPNFYAWGPEFADAEASYRMNFRPLFNTTTLRDYFAALGFGFATPDAPCFAPSIDIPRYARGTRPLPPARRRLAVYGRPAVARNMFPLAVEGIERFLQQTGLSPARIEILSVGMPHDHVTLPGGHQITCLGKLPLQDYPDWLLTVDVGLSLMLSPHPSHPPLEMAAAGVRVVTNRFASKDLSRLTPAILSVDTTPQAVADGLAQAWAMGPASDAERSFSLAPLGVPLSQVIDRLSAELRAGQGGG
jgi:glycosyltransferase involved in cell wall biosynthesis